MIYCLFQFSWIKLQLILFRAHPPVKSVHILFFLMASVQLKNKDLLANV